MRAGGGELRRLAAGRGAEIGDAPAANVAEQARRQRGGGVLHPPGAFGKAGQRRHRAMRDGAHRSGRQDAAVELGRPEFRIAFHREVERRLLPVGRGDRVRGCAAVGRGPARHQPVGRVERRHIERGERGFAVARQPPQHRIDQSGIARGVAVGLHQPHRKIDRGMVGHVEKQNLRGAEQERGLDPRRLRRQAAFEERPQQMAQACRAAAARCRPARGRARGRAPPASRARSSSSSSSSSARRRRSTPSSISAATRRAARPGTWPVLGPSCAGTGRLRLTRAFHYEEIPPCSCARATPSQAMPTDQHLAPDGLARRRRG